MLKKIAILLTFLLVTTCSTVVFAAEATHKNPDEKAEYLFDVTSGFSACQLEAGKDIAQYMSVDRPFSQIQIDCPSWSNNIGSMTMNLYNWKGDYSSTVASEPVASEKFVDYEDNSWLALKAENGKSFPAGEYLWVITEPVETVGIWKAQYDNMDSSVEVVSYLNGVELEGTYNSCIIFAGNDGTTDSVMDSQNVIMYVDSNVTYVQGAKKVIDVPATVIEGRTLVPVRFVSESLGAVVNYVAESRTVVIEKGELVITLVIGSNEMKVNGASKFLDVPARTINDRTVVPLRAIAEALGEQVNYFPDGSKGLIVVGAKASFFDIDKAESIMKIYR